MAKFSISLIVVCIFISIAASTDALTVTVGQNQSVRVLSEEYLGNPDLWEDILRANGLASPHEVRPGMPIKIPVKAITGANRDLSEAEDLIGRATKSGARIFAGGIIDEANNLKDEALKKRKAGQWNDAGKLAQAASAKAKAALDICLANQDAPAEALVDDLRGDVHALRPADIVWREVRKKQILSEGEKVRTLSQSYANIVFRDDSRLHLKENAQALIRRMRSNLLNETEEARISLIEGDVMALLAGGKAGDNVKIDIPGVETKIKSNSYWIGRDGDGARFANYQGEMEISSGGVRVVLKENQGSVVPKDRSPSAPRDLLRAPAPLKPENGEDRFDIDKPFSWTAVEGADRYLVEVAHDATFSDVILREEPKGTSFILPAAIGSGAYYWRIAAVSREQLPGRRSGIRFFRIAPDDKPPFLALRSPAEGIIVPEDKIEFSGSAELGAAVTVGKKTVNVSLGGEFRITVPLALGENRISARAEDRAGNVTELVRTVVRVAQKEIRVAYGAPLREVRPGEFLSPQKRFTLAGTTENKAVIDIRSEDGVFGANATVDEKGRFRINMEMRDKKETFAINVASMAGNTHSEKITIEVDNIPPEIRLSNEIPAVTGTGGLRAGGVVEGGTGLQINGREIILYNGRFDEELELKPGTNVLIFESRDAAGNTALIEKHVVFDSEAPEIAGYKIAPKTVAGGETINVRLTAKDATGYVRAVPYRIGIGEFEHTGLLILSGAKGEYADSFDIPKGVRGKPRLKSVKLSDYAGNEKEYLF